MTHLLTYLLAGELFCRAFALSDRLAAARQMYTAVSALEAQLELFPEVYIFE